MRGDSLPSDASHCDLDAEMRHMMMELRLPSLFDRHKQLASEVSALESDVHMIVYENYTKFMAATDIIKSMSTDMTGMDDEMKCLHDTIGTVVQQSNTINHRLRSQQLHLEEYNRMQLLLHKLKAIFQVPYKIEKAIDNGAIDIAAETYAEIAPLLRSYGDRAAIRTLAETVYILRDQIAHKLKNKLLTEPNEVSECVLLLAKVDEPIESLQNDFMTCQRNRLQRLWTSHEDVDTSASPKSIAASLSNALLPEMYKTATLSKELFHDNSHVLTLSRDIFTSYTKTLKKCLAEISTFASRRAAGISVYDDRLETQLEDLIVKGRDGLISEPGVQYSAVKDTYTSDWGSRSILEVLFTMKRHIEDTLPSVLPELALHDRTAEIIEAGIRIHVDSAFQSLFQRLKLTVEAAVCLPHEGEEIHGILQLVVEIGFQQLLLDLKEIETQAWAVGTWRDIFSSSIHTQGQSVIHHLAESCLVLAGRQECTVRTLSVLQLLCMKLQQRSSLSTLDDLLHHLFPDGFGFDQNWISSELSNTIKQLLEGFITDCSATLSEDLVLKTESEDWPSYSKEINGPREACVAFFETLHDVSVPIINDQRLFTLASIAHQTLTALADCMRRITSISNIGFQQIQIDAHWLRLKLSSMMQGSVDTPAVLRLLDDIVATAAESCGEPKILDATFIDTMMNTYYY